MNYKIISKITDIKTFAEGSGIRELSRLKKIYGDGRWKKRKGYADIRLANGVILKAELHWYEAGNIGKKEVKIKRFIGD